MWRRRRRRGRRGAEGKCSWWCAICVVVAAVCLSVCRSVGRSVGGWRSGGCSSSAFLFALRYYDTNILILFPSLSPPSHFFLHSRCSTVDSLSVFLLLLFWLLLLLFGVVPRLFLSNQQGLPLLVIYIFSGFLFGFERNEIRGLCSVFVFLLRSVLSHQRDSSRKRRRSVPFFFLSVVTDKEIETEDSSFLMTPLLLFLIFFFASSGSGNAATSHLPRLSFRLSCFGLCYNPLEPSVVSRTDYSIAILSASTSSQAFSPSLHSRPLHPFSVVLLVMWSFFFVLEKFWH